MRSPSSPKVRRDIGRNVAERRRALGFTQERLAEKLDVSPRYVQTVEAGRENLTLDTLCKVAGALQTTFYALILGERTPSSRTRRKA